MTDGAVAIKSRLNSRSSRSWMISRCSSPRNPQRKPKTSGAQVPELGGIDRKQSAEHHRDRGLEAGQRLVHRIALVGDGVADARIRDLLDRCREHADLAGTKFVDQ